MQVQLGNLSGAMDLGRLEPRILPLPPTGPVALAISVILSLCLLCEVQKKRSLAVSTWGLQGTEGILGREI